MEKSIRMLLLTLFVGVLIVAIILTFASLGIANPVPWLLVILLAAIPYILNRMESRHFVTWNEAYSVGIQAIDDDHKTLLNLINQLQTAVHYKTGDEFEKQALDGLVRYTKTHFAREERLMQDNGYPDFAAHKAEHEAMIARVNEFLDLYEEKGHLALEEAADYLKNWLITHINGTDQKYSPYLREKGVV